MSKVKRLPESEHRIRFLTEEEEVALLRELPRGVRPIVELAIHTGIRRGALLGLQWQDVHFETETIRVPDYLSKNRQAYVVHMNARVLELLRDARSRKGFLAPADYVFPKPGGSQRRSIRTTFEKARERAGLEDVRFHDLRHTAASRIVMGGGTLYDAAEHLGHRSTEMTRRYAHLSRSHMKGVAALTMRGAEVVSLSKARDSGTDSPRAAAEERRPAS